MAHGDNANLWLQNLNLANLSFIMRKIPTQESSNEAHITPGKLFWTLVAVANALIIGDVLLNPGRGLIDLFFLLTGGY